MYGGTQRFFRLVAKPTYGMDVTFVDMSDPAAVARAIRVDPTGGPASTKLIWLETPTNPT